MTIKWPMNFPSEDEMKDLLKETIFNIWKVDLNVSDIDEWLTNFKGKIYSKEEERRLALWLLCNFTYYNEQEVNHLCNILYKKLVHDIAFSEKIVQQQDLDSIIKMTKFAALGNASESGAMLLYFFRQAANISIKQFVYPTAFPKEKDTIHVFIDDVTLSGSTASRFFKNNKASIECKKAYYITLFATKEAIEELSKYGVTILYCILLDERDRAFSDKSMIYSKFPELNNPSYKIAFEYGKEIAPENPLGFKDCELCFGFHYNIPNNTLPIFWGTNNWVPILQRKEKIYGTQKANFDRYI